ncbi:MULTISPECIES: hypothetical protein [unclassified Azospirillum]|uniref:hypothetical protein n=1 Tax=unclassified Azospirillum TaxID=2630922 RepID=UPI000B673185|nr:MULTISPECIES: hypothetical protein [unclassified Azospirillum]SNS83609.1 hypothetical protein SAMN05880556_11317 [Azospirillum sp. RU38E]SNT00770.1 hypothetical protein SAMN05880591_11316 [Azospirillum sp. RU37A]
MVNTVRIKRRASGNPGAPGVLENAELAFNEVEDVLYYGKGNGGSGGSATNVIAIGGSGAYSTLAGNQTISGAKTLTGQLLAAGAGAVTVPSVSQGSNDTSAANTAWVRSYAQPVAATLTALSALGSNGIVVKTAAGAVAARQIEAAAGRLTIANADGIAANPLLDLATVGTAGTYSKLTTDAYGRVVAGGIARLDELAAPTAPVALNGFRLTGLADPVNAQDAATKNYVDLTVQGLDPKQSVRAATTGPVTLSGTQTIDGVALVAGDRVLVKNQANASQNGIYIVASGAWTRAADMDVWSEFVSAYFFVEMGTVNAEMGFICTADAGGTLGSSAVNFVQFNGAGQVVAGDGLGKNGNSLFVTGTANRIVASGTGVDIATTYAGQTSINTLGTIGTGTWNATIIGLAYGGTGANLSGASDGTIFKKNGSALVPATPGTDFLNSTSTIDGGVF